MEEENEVQVKPGGEGRKKAVIPRTTTEAGQRRVWVQRGLQLASYRWPQELREGKKK